MKRFDMCIIEKSEIKEYVNAYAFILDIEGYEPNYLLEIWNFEMYDGAEIDCINPKHLRKATKEEEEEYMKKFNEYIADWQDNKT